MVCRLWVGMFPLILTVLSRDDNRGYHTPYQGLFVEGGTSQVAGLRFHDVSGGP